MASLRTKGPVMHPTHSDSRSTDMYEVCTELPPSLLVD
ncbi:hypothetical protein OOU_Y34scaffold00669g51 [Pyricularia oryzae Y34]|uniref:Uncharacterized protein n=2 Tax=Pyricularia oryzae TaxID=318829 RepID=A0AA97NTG6_PYRO3|nr:hypothetical protein OOU_Y34scaffold00669g51 [Pyricularia oryzae Y34]